MRLRTAVVPAAGLGTRFLPVTKSVPKEMLPVVDKPLIQYSVEDAIACGAEVVVVVVGPGGAAIEDYFSKSPRLEEVLKSRGETALLERIRALSSMADIRFVRQATPRGLGHAVLAAKKIVGHQPFMLLLPDDLFEIGEAVLGNMTQVSQAHAASVVAVMRVDRNETSRYGVIRARKAADSVYRVFDCVEKPPAGEAPSTLAIMGRYILMPDVFDALEETEPGKNGEIQLTDALARLARKSPMYAYQFPGKRYDLGTPLGWLKTNAVFALRNPLFKKDLAVYLEQALRSAGRDD